jgi:hypothetical protein
MALAGYAIQSLNEGGAFGPRREAARKRRR